MSEDAIIARPPSRALLRAAAQSALLRGLLAIGVGLFASAVLIVLTGKDPAAAYNAFVQGAFGSFDRVVVALNKATPYILSGVGVALCFRANVINIGGEGQIAIGGLTATWAALSLPLSSPLAALPVALIAGALGGMAWAGVATLIHLLRGVHEVLVTLLLNFVAVLLVIQVLQGPLGEIGAGFPQSPLLPDAFWLPKLVARTDLHIGILLALVAAVAAHIYLWRTTGGFRLRIVGASRSAAGYSGFSAVRTTILVMMVGGGLSGLAGAVEVMGLHNRLIAGFSQGFGFNAVAIALLGALNPLMVVPAGLFFGFLEAGALAMQRQIGIPSSLVAVVEGTIMLCVLVAMAGGGKRGH